MPDLLNLMVDSGAADLHVRVGIPPCYRDGGTLKRVEGPPCEQEDVEYLVKAIANDDEVQNIRTQGGADFGFAFGTKARPLYPVSSQALHPVPSIGRISFLSSSVNCSALISS